MTGIIPKNSYANRMLQILLALIVSSTLLTACGLVNDIGQEASQQASCNSAHTLIETGREVGLATPKFTANTVSALALAQSFTITAPIQLRFVELYLAASATLPANNELRLEIQGDANGKPDGVNLGSAFIQSSLVTVNQIRGYTFGLGSLGLAANRKYWLRLSSNLPNDANIYVVWAGSSNNAFSRGEATYSLAANSWLRTRDDSANFGGENHDFAFGLRCQ